MSVRILTANGDEAIFNRGRWTSENEELEDVLNENFTMEIVPACEPVPYNYLATKVVESLGGEVIEFEVPQAGVPGRVY